MKRTLLALGMAAGLIGCSGMEVNHDYDREADFSSFQTYSWQDSEHSIADSDPLGHGRLMSAIDAQMRANGFRKASANPDVIIIYNVEETEEMSLNTTYMGGGWGMGPGWGRGRAGMRGGMRGTGGMAASTTTVQKYNVGTLVLDMWDVEDHQLVWRGIASSNLSTDPKKNAKKIDQAAQKLFEKYPPSNAD